MNNIENTKLPAKYKDTKIIGEVYCVEFKDGTIVYYRYHLSDFLDRLAYLVNPPKPDTYKLVMIDIRTGKIKEIGK